MSIAQLKESDFAVSDDTVGNGQLCLFDIPSCPVRTHPVRESAKRDHVRSQWRKRSADYRLRKRGRQAEVKLIGAALNGSRVFESLSANDFSLPLLREIWNIAYLEYRETATCDVENVITQMAAQGMPFWDRGRWLRDLAASAQSATDSEIPGCVDIVQRAIAVSDPNWRPILEDGAKKRK